MKKFFKIGLIAAISLTISAAQANDNEFSLKAKNEKQKTISFLMNDNKEFNFSIFSDNKDLLFEQKFVGSAGLTKTYDLNALPDGTYTIKVESGSTLAQYAVKISNEKALISDAKIFAVYKPVITKDKDLVTLDFEVKEKTPIEVTVFNERNDELYSEVFKDRSKLIKKFNISKADGDSLTFVVKYNNESFTKTIETR
ncbi:hypothetical protein DU508_12105 [Pedobacter chinensis]|uniref:Uncharacterized protein n=1 Tax=Pedobacter chinensis TaxID=2282421 RepID=A0A369PUL1_9SPHI|nr:hypothetical protein [Pedobacter chinensis]RDC56341.1 hypothetical protein DU508_12105 [Pedobacter chinensis]